MGQWTGCEYRSRESHVQRGLVASDFAYATGRFASCWFCRRGDSYFPFICEGPQRLCIFGFKNRFSVRQPASLIQPFVGHFALHKESPLATQN